MLIVSLAATALVPAELVILRKLHRQGDRSIGYYVVALLVGNLVVPLVALFLAIALSGEPEPMWAACVILGTPFLAWIIIGLRRSSGPRRLEQGR